LLPASTVGGAAWSQLALVVIRTAPAFAPGFFPSMAQVCPAESKKTFISIISKGMEE